jgi:glycerol uptake facilitator-like aquaporin
VKRVFAEALSTAFLLAAVVGSGIMGERLSGGNDAVTLLANSLATGFALVALIVAFAPRSGAHFNPVVTLALWPYLAAQCIGAIAGVLAAHAMFDMPLLQSYGVPRTGWAQWWSECVATFGLVFIVLSLRRDQPWAAPAAIGAYIAAAYWFTASTSFANPAVTLARGLTASFAGIRLEDAAGFVAAQLLGGLLGLWADRALQKSPL